MFALAPRVSDMRAEGTTLPQEAKRWTGNPLLSTWEKELCQAHAMDTTGSTAMKGVTDDR